jgi:hypothetical protein
MSGQSQQADLADMIRELTEPYTHREPYWVRANGRDHLHSHRGDHPSLLDQLRAVCEPGLLDDVGSRVGKSKPPVALSALDVLLRIEASSADWVTRRLRLTLRDTVEANLHLLAGHPTEAFLVKQVESWWRMARVESHWDGRPRDLRDPCPYCSQRMLRVAWDVSAAWCRECGADWGAADVGVLGAMLDAQRVDLTGTG